jgi:hypothetical protein
MKMLTLCVLLIGLCGPIYGIGLSYADRQVFPHGYVDFNNTGPLALADYPFASPERQLTFQTSMRQLYNIRELTDNRAAFAYRHKDYICGLALASFGTPDYFHQTGLAASLSIRRKTYSIGASIVYDRMSFNDYYGYLSAYAGNAGFSFRYSRAFIYAVTRVINQPSYYKGGSPEPPQAEFGLSLASKDGLDSQFKALFIRYHKPTAEISQSFELASYAQLNWALVLLPARFGLGLDLERGRFGFGYHFSHHPVLGATHAVILTVYSAHGS